MLRFWPDTRAERIRAALALGALACVSLYAAYRVKVHFGIGQGDLRPIVAGPVPERTPLPHADLTENVQNTPIRSQWVTTPVRVREAIQGRQSLWIVPEGAPRSLVIVLHGDGGDARGFHQQFSYEEASGGWAVLIYPDGVRRGWDTESAQDNKDIAFLDTLIDMAIAEHGVDPAQVFLTGYSSGGFLAQLYACQRSSRVRAIATHESGAPYNQAERWPNGSPKCPGQTPVAMMAAHEREDLSVSFRSGEYSAKYWEGVNGCDISRAEPTGYAQCYAYAGCSKPAVFCDIPGLGHWIWNEGAPASVRFFQRTNE